MNAILIVNLATITCFDNSLLFETSKKVKPYTLKSIDTNFGTTRLFLGKGVVFFNMTLTS